MGHAANRPSRRWIAGLAPALLAALALPLMAPTCGSNSTGPKVFSKGSLIIPMDECYQNTPTTLTNAVYSAPYSGCPTNGTATYDAGNVLRAYGLVYQLLRNNIPVYWVINPNKTALLDSANPDITLSLNGGPPVGKYQWGNPGVVGSMPPNNNTTTINYHGGPFVVDGSDAAAASAVMQALKATFGGTPPSTTNGPNLVNVHVANLAFSATVAKSMSGGFQNSGGANAPPIALLNITGGDAKNSEVVIQGYLVDAGLGPADFAGAGGVATPTGHGKIYDDLYPADFLPVACTTTCANGSPCVGGTCSPSLTYFGYSILWVPHWCAKGSANIPTGFTYLDILTQIRNFMNASHDVMAECASLGAFEGVDNSTACSGAANTFDPGTGHIQATQVQTTTGVNVNETNLAGGLFRGPFPSPFLQLGDFPFTPVTGAIQQYSPAAAYVTRPAGYDLMRLISDSTNSTKDYFTVLPTYNGMGTVVYLAGHDFSGGQGATPQLAGSRLVLNTLFNLGNACYASGATCDTGKLGVCAKGRMDCCGPTDTGCTVGQPFCRQTVFPSAEVCDGLDNDCNGAVDDIPTTQFYAYTPGAGDPQGPGCTLVGSSYQCQGLCHPGLKSCIFPPPGVTPPPTPGTVVPLTIVSPETTPVPEVCDGLDNDCDGVVDNGIAPRPCYDGATGCTWNATAVPPRYDCLGTCTPGTQTCSNGSFGLCTGEVLPAPEMCEPPQDTNCNGIVGDGCGCIAGATRICYTGPAGTENVGLCRSGTQTCSASGQWPNACTGQVLPAARGCDALDHDCDGVPDDQETCCVGGVPQATATRSCYDGPAGTANVGVCISGTQTCSNGVWTAACVGEIAPAPVELCNGKNDTCSTTWTTDDGTGACGVGFTCVNGACVPTVCGPESFCPTGYACVGTSCAATPCAGSTPANTPCPQGQVCKAGACVDPCAGVTCGPGAFCSGGACVGGGCLATGCPAGQVCLSGTCQTDACGSVTCPSGTFCRQSSAQAYCVQSCAFVYCAAGQRCGPDGFCVADPCNGVTCAAGQVCTGGACAADPCLSVTCGAGQSCQGGLCVGNPCNGVVCPVGQCVGGQCYSSANPTGAGGIPPPALPPQPSTGKSGCGCGGDASGGLALLLGLVALPFSRRRRLPRPPTGGAALLAVLLALAATGMGCGSKSDKAGPCTATTCGSTCTDLKIDPANCGSCGAACGGGQICVDAHCGPASSVAPHLDTLTPPAAPTGGTASIGVAGQRFQNGAIVVALGISAPPIPTTFVDSGHLTAQVDLSSVSPAAAELRVVNPDKVISNGLPFDVTTPAPIITPPLNPAQAVTRAGQPPGTTLPIAVAGSGFVASSQCHMSGPGFPEQGLATTYGSATAVQCALDLSTTQPGTYALTVVNGAVNSNSVSFTVTSGTPALTSISPTGGAAGTITSITASGSGFDSTSQVLFDGAPSGMTTHFIGPGSLYAEPLALTGASGTLGAHSVTVRNGSGGTPTAAQTFTVTSAAPQLSSVSVAPSPVRQGQPGTLTLTGINFDTTSRISILPPGGTAVSLTPATQTSTQLTVSYTFAVAGSYSVSVVNGAQSSGALAVTAISNVAVLAGITPASAQQGATAVTLTLSASNIDSTATVHIAAPDLADTILPSTVALPSTLTVSSFAIPSTWNTETYAVTVVNSGAAPSNGIGFTVTPGQPTLTSALTTAAPQKACAVQGPTPVPITLAGTNFAKPDASGNGGSSVHASSAALGVTDYLIPAAATTVADTTHINVSFDTTLAVPGTYDIAVWNPGPTILKSAQNVTFQILASGTCP